jgi:hypothetical protein
VERRKKLTFLQMDLGVLKALEREKVLEVLQRDKLLRSTDDVRIR